jgi:hypothetical protein
MSGGNVTYQLRPNKHVERLLFVELVEKIGAYKASTFAYISMGGPQLEDHKLFHQVLGITNLYSFEEDEIIYQRQKFNQRPSCVTCIPRTISDFVVNFEHFIDENALMDKTLVIWLDYASPKRREQLIEFESKDHRITPVLLSQFSYQDSDHIMLTATIRLTIKSEEDDFRKSMKNKWEYLPEAWRDVRHINIPALSAKERLEIDSKLPADDFEALHEKLPFRLHTDNQKSLEMLREYARHYRRYPSYFQVVL